jgi:hypothetical protein
MAMGIVARSTALARVVGMRKAMQVYGPDVLPRERRRTLSARATGRSEMLLVVIVGRGRHPLFTARRRVEDLGLLS